MTEPWPLVPPKGLYALCNPRNRSDSAGGPAFVDTKPRKGEQICDEQANAPKFKTKTRVDEDSWRWKGDNKDHPTI